MKSILVVEDSTMVMKIIKHVLSQSPLIHVDYAMSFAEARALVEKNGPYFAALVDLSLPDAPSGEVVDYTLEQKIPTIVLTSTFDEKRREALLNKGIVDYVTKEGKYSYELALNTIHRLLNNEKLKVLVVDDSSVQRKMLRNLLRLHLFQVLEASDGVDAIKMVLENPDIQLLITDFNMPRMDGCELIKNLRVKYEKSDLVIIGLSSEGEGALSAKFIKHGANDFLRKPFNHEEFFCRVNHNVEFLELIERIRDAAKRDELTGAYNRQYFFSHGQSLHLSAKSSESKLAAAIIDLDHLADINREYGSDAGDQLMYQLAQRLNETFERFFFARGDGQQFFVLLPGLSNEKAVAYIEKVRQIIASTKFQTDSSEIGVTFTAGVSNQVGDSVDELLHNAEHCLKRAKDAGGDIVIGD